VLVLLVQDRRDLLVVDVVLVVPVAAGVDDLRLLLTSHGLDRRGDDLLVDADRLLCDGAEHQPAAGGFHLAMPLSTPGGGC
jgi:hypothetical protein